MNRTDIATGFGNLISYVKYTFTFSDLTTAGATQTIQLLADPGGNSIQVPDTTGSALNSANFQVPKGGVVLYVKMFEEVQFASASTNALTLSLGKTGGSATAITAASSTLFAAQSNTTIALETSAIVASGQASGYGVSATFTATNGNVNACTAGQVAVYFLYVNPSSIGSTTTYVPGE